MEQPTKRRICWPNPDATCLQGGCIHCEGYPYRSLNEIEKWAMNAGDVPNRYGSGKVNALKAFHEGFKYATNIDWK